MIWQKEGNQEVGSRLFLTFSSFFIPNLLSPPPVDRACFRRAWRFFPTFHYAKVTLRLAQRIRGAGSDPGLLLLAIQFAGEVGETG